MVHMISYIKPVLTRIKVTGQHISITSAVLYAEWKRSDSTLKPSLGYVGTVSMSSTDCHHYLGFDTQSGFLVEPDPVDTRLSQKKKKKFGNILRSTWD
jgi:hypothetical protein